MMRYMVKINSNISLIAVVGLLVIISGCINSNEPKEIKIINLHAQQLIIDENDVKEVLGQDWKISNKPTGCSTGRRTCDELDQFLQIKLKSNVSRTYESELIKKSGDASIQYDAYIQVLVFNSIDEAKRAYSDMVYIIQPSDLEESIGIGDYGGILTKDGYIYLSFVKNNVFSEIVISRTLLLPYDLSETEKTEMIGVDKAYNLAKKQEAKISKILDML